ncbi:MAG: hypothetical protein KatS3mg055_0109 [Chloroflexus sp.]|uniref:hypothetical protein n=1 Tax=Chloroflexus sp. TaxID=1904827 RepID=UPI0021DEE8A0|nr:hypothetical protein [Chloroflexus sp.]GIV87591.1 MAG: hypothetical protein KatS3mg055_0109 [Chloroflexus sp.]
MLTYEQLISLLIESLEEQDLPIAHTQELLDVHSLGRNLRITCLPPNLDTNGVWMQPPLRAVITVNWPAELTVASLHGQPIIDVIHKIVNEQMPSVQPLSTLLLEVTYFLPLSDEERQAADIELLAARVFDLFIDQPNVEDNLEISGLLRARGRQASILAHLTATRLFPVEHLHVDSVAETIDTLCNELREMLPRLANVFQAAKIDNDRGLDPQFYLRPPTA